MNQPDTCQICKKDFAQGDAVVVCPHCGAPYHKECYVKEGHCVYENKHASGFEYKPLAQKQTEQKTHTEKQQTAQNITGATYVSGAKTRENKTNDTQNEGGVLCQSCRTVNARDHIFCERCGRPLHNTAATGPKGPFSLGGMPPFARGGLMAGAPGVDMQGEFDGLSKRDWAAFIGQSVPSYFLRMSQQDTRKSKLSFTLSAFFFSYLYFAYRKMWKWAAIALALEVLFLVPDFLSLYVEAGVPFAQGFSLTLLSDLQMVFYVLGIVRNVVFGVFALYLYRKDAAGKIRALQENAGGGQNYLQLLAQKGGVSIVGVIAAFGVLFLISTLWVMGGGDTLVAYMSEMMNMAPLAL